MQSQTWTVSHVTDTIQISNRRRLLSRPFLSIIIPAFNEEQRIGNTIQKIVTYLRNQPYSWEILIVDDGSTDRTANLANDCATKTGPVRVESIPHSGKGWAVRHGMLAAQGDLRFMCDADLSMPIKHIDNFIGPMHDGYDVVIGSREAEGARRFNEPALRHFMGRIFNRLVAFTAVAGFQDTQCGFKCFRAESAIYLFEAQTTSGFAFDVEILFLAAQSGLRVLEIPIDWYHNPMSKVRPLVDSFSMARDTLLVRGRHRVT